MEEKQSRSRGRTLKGGAQRNRGLRFDWVSGCGRSPLGAHNFLGAPAGLRSDGRCRGSVAARLRSNSKRIPSRPATPHPPSTRWQRACSALPPLRRCVCTCARPWSTRSFRSLPPLWANRRAQMSSTPTRANFGRAYPRFPWYLSVREYLPCFIDELNTKFDSPGARFALVLAITARLPGSLRVPGRLQVPALQCLAQRNVPAVLLARSDMQPHSNFRQNVSRRAGPVRSDHLSAGPLLPRRKHEHFVSRGHLLPAGHRNSVSLRVVHVVSGNCGISVRLGSNSAHTEH